MSATERDPMIGFDLAAARRAILRYQPASNWVLASRDPTPRMTVGLGFDVSRSESQEVLRRVGLDPAAVRSGRTPVSDGQMDELFDLALQAAIGFADRRVPGFHEMPSERQSAVLELIVWLGIDGTSGVFGELERLGVAPAEGAAEPSRWFDAPPGAASPPEPDDEPSDEETGPAFERLVPPEPAAGRPAPSCEITFESFGVVAELSSDDPDLLRAAEAMLPPGWCATDADPDARFGIWADGLITADGTWVDWAATRWDSLLRLGSIIRHHVAKGAPGYAFVHAGVVDAGGCGIVIPGHSFTGKTTLVAEIVRLGAKYLSDEYAVVDPTGLVWPFAKPLSIRPGRRNRFAQLVPVPEPMVARHPVHAGLIVLTGYEPGGRWRPSVRSQAEGAFALLQNTVSARRRPSSALSAASMLARDAIVLVGRRGEAPETALRLLEAALLRSGASVSFVA
jgi:hypothetical protein